MVELKELAKVCQSASEAEYIAQEIEVVLEALRKVGKPSRCKDLQSVIEGPKWRYTVAHIAKMLGFAKQMGLVVRTEVDGEPIEVEAYGYDYADSQKIVVNGVTYIAEGASRHYGYFAKTITPKIALYSVA